jgi:uncharacterized protein (TIGR00369 family)
MLLDIFEHRLRFNEVIGLRVESWEPDAPGLAFDMRPELVGSHLHPRLHGGVIATALDTVGGFALILALADRHVTEPAEQIVARLGRFGTIDLRVDYLQPGIGRSFHAGATVVRLGNRLASVRMELRSDDGRLIATGAAAYVTS